MKWIIVLTLVALVAVVFQVGSAAEPAATQPAATQPAAGANVVEIDGTRLTLLGVSSGIAFVEDDAFNGRYKAGDRKLHYVKTVFLREGKGGVIGEPKINGEPPKRIRNSGGTESAPIPVDLARARWPGAGRMERIPAHAKDTDVILEYTHFGVAPLPPQFNLSFEIAGRTFEFLNVAP